MLTMIIVPRHDASTCIRRTVVVTEVVVLVSRPHPKMELQQIGSHHDSRREPHMASCVNLTVEVTRREQDSATLERIIPVSAAVIESSRRPLVTCRNPDPIGISARPIAWSPDVTILHPVPTARNPDMFYRRSNAHRPLLKRLRRRLFQILNFCRGRGNPCPRNPLITALGFGPVARQPPKSLWYFSPDAADPHKVFAVVIPRPVTRNPLDSPPFRTNFRRNFLNRFRRLRGDNQTRQWIRIDLLSKGFMHWPPQHSFRVFFRKVGRVNRSQHG